MLKVAMALGGGGVKGVAHVLVLEALDELGLGVSEVAGSSIGAIVGAMHLGGMSGRDVRAHFVGLSGRRRHLFGKLYSAHALSFRGITRARKTGWSPFDGIAMLQQFLPRGLPENVEGLCGPMTVVATCMEREVGVAFRAGNLIRVLAASSAIPGLMRPVRIGHHVYLDGSVLEPVPVRHVTLSDPVVAVDLTGGPVAMTAGAPLPSATLTAIRSAHMMNRAIAAANLRERPDAIVLKPPLPPIRATEFHRLGEIFEMLRPFKDSVKRSVAAAVERCGSRQSLDSAGRPVHPNLVAVA